MEAAQQDTSELHRLRLALRSSEALNQRIFDAFPGGLVHVARNGAILSANAVAQRLLDLSYDAIRSRYYADFEPLTIWEDGTPCRAEDYPVARCLSSGEPQDAVTIGLRRPNDTIVWADFSAVPVHDPETGECTSAIVTIMDATGRKETQKEIEQLSLAVENAMQGIARLDPEGLFTRVHDGYARMLGYEPEEMIGLSWAETIPEDDHAEAISAVKKMLEDGQAEVKLLARRKDGSLFHKKLLLVKSFDESGMHDGHFCFMRDVTESTLLEQARRESEVHLRTVLDSEPECVATLAPDGSVLDINPAGLAMLETGDLATVKGRSLDEFVTTEHRAAFRELHEGVFRGESGRLTFEIVGRKGTRRWLENHAVPLDNADGITIAQLAVIRDITDSKRAEAERERTIDELQAKNTELEQFTYTVSHDLKTPLLTINGFIGLLKQDLAAQDRDAADDDLSQIEVAAKKMAVLLDDLLELSRIGRTTLPPETVALADIINEAVKQLAGELETTDVRLVVAPGLPSIYGDKLRLPEVFKNLIANAIRYRGDHPKPEIRIGAEIVGDEVECTVEDNGIGIDPVYQRKIFKLFEKLDGKAGGTGVGLALVERIVSVHGGRVWVESEGDGKGTAFRFTLPLPPAEIADPQRRGD